MQEKEKCKLVTNPELEAAIAVVMAHTGLVPNLIIPSDELIAFAHSKEAEKLLNEG